jgi:sigma-B regulation protein RsbU (phosphoserine phosphatase)
MSTNDLKNELARLRKERTALRSQFALFEKFISMTRSHDEPEVIRAILHDTIETSIELTRAELGSLILLDDEGSIIDSILCRGKISPEFEEGIIKSVLKKGLAGWVLRHGKIGLIKDTETDDRWIELPDQPYTARSVLALPIISGERRLAILTLMHSVPDHFTADIVELMKNTANQIALVLENAYLFDNLNESYNSLGKAQEKIASYSKALDRELQNCGRIQKNFLPGELPDVPGWDIEEFFFPARRVSGDFYDVFRLPGGYTGLVIGDVCDKGAGSALFMALTRSLIRIFSGQAQLNRSPINPESKTVGGSPDPQKIRKYTQLEAIRAIALTNDYLAANNDMCMFVTLFFGVLDPETGKLLFINCGHEPVLVIDSSGIKEKIGPTGPAVGIIPHATFTYKEIELHPGEILFAFTDGVTDARSVDDKRFTRRRLNAILSQPVPTVFDLMQRIGTDLFAHIGMATQADDITMLALQREIQ